MEKALKELKTEDYIWLISLFSAFLAIISNHYERSYLLTKNKRDQQIFKTINIGLLTTTFFIYLYFLLLSYSRFKENSLSLRDFCLKNLNFVAASLFLIGGILYLLSAILNSDEVDLIL